MTSWTRPKMSRVKFVATKGLSKSGKIQIRTIYALPAAVKLAEPPMLIPRPASPTGPPKATSQQNQNSSQNVANNNPPASSSSLRPSQSPSATPLFSPILPSNGSIRNLPQWLFSSSPTSTHLPGHYRFNSAAYGIPKQRPIPLPAEDPSLHLSVQIGEDAYFVAQNGLGVADGVGGWSAKHSHASNSSLFSRRLMHYCSLELQAATDPDPVYILQKSYTTAIGLSVAEGLVGSSTALLAVLTRDGSELRLAHVGDCCLYLIRDREIVFRSEEMQHSFNFPLQLGPLSPTNPQDHAHHLSLPVQENDIIILSTDGMSDNLWDEDVIDQLSKLAAPLITPMGTGMPLLEPSTALSPLRTALLPTSLSHSLCARARSVADNGPSSRPGISTAETPFGRRAKEAGLEFVGGKPDDITVVVAVISRTPSGV